MYLLSAIGIAMQAPKMQMKEFTRAAFKVHRSLGVGGKRGSVGVVCSYPRRLGPQWAPSVVFFATDGLRALKAVGGVVGGVF